MATTKNKDEMDRYLERWGDLFLDPKARPSTRIDPAPVECRPAIHAQPIPNGTHRIANTGIPQMNDLVSQLYRDAYESVLHQAERHYLAIGCPPNVQLQIWTEQMGDYTVRVNAQFVPTTDDTRYRNRTS